MNISPCTYRDRRWCRIRAFVENSYIQFLTICLGFFSLANVYALYGFPQMKVIAFVVTGIVVSISILRALYLPEKIIAELKTPAGLAAYQTGVMSVYFFSVFLASLDRPFGQGVWCVAFATNLLLIILFVQQNIRYGFSFLAITPVWYLIFVGIGAGGITAQQIGFTRISVIIAVYAALAYVIMTPLVLIRLTKYNPLVQKMQPTKAILCAAPSLSLVGLLTVYPNLPFYIALPFIILSQFFLYLLYGNFYLFTYVPFCVTFSSFTFPLGISATALFMFRHIYLDANSVAFKMLGILGAIELVVATYIIFYVIWLFFYNTYWLWYSVGLKVKQMEKLCKVDS